MNDYLKNNDYFKAIINYLANKLSNKERNEVESICQADAFEQEAMDGFANLSPNEIISDIESLNVIKGKNKFKHWNLVLIGAVLLILLSSLLLYILRKDKPIATQEPEIEIIEFINDTQTFQNDTIVSSDTTQLNSEQVEIKEEEEETIEETPPTKDEEKTEEQLPVEEKKNEVQIKVKEEKQTETQEPSIKIQDSVTEETNQDTTEEDITPVPEDENEIEHSTPNNDTLKSTSINSFGLNTEPTPQGGMELYNIYLSENQILPLSSDSVDNRAVNLQFTIDIFGNPKDILINESPDSLFSKEAKRLVEEGPRWTPTIEDGTPIEGNANLTITFFP